MKRITSVRTLQKFFHLRNWHWSTASQRTSMHGQYGNGQSMRRSHQRLVRGCLKPTPTDNLYMLSGIASRKERQWKLIDILHLLHGPLPIESRLKTRESVIKIVVRVTTWNVRLSKLPASTLPTVHTQLEAFPPDADSRWVDWKCPNRCTAEMRLAGEQRRDVQMWYRITEHGPLTIPPTAKTAMYSIRLCRIQWRKTVSSSGGSRYCLCVGTPKRISFETSGNTTM